MTIVQLEYLIALSQTRNYSEAARNCNITQPTMSMQLRKLEDGFGESLIKRGKSPVEFTLLGENVLQQAKIVLQEFENLKYIQNQSKGDLNLEITIGIIPTIAPYLIPVLAGKFKEIFSNLTVKFVELKTEDLIESVNEMDVDYGVLSGPYNGHLKQKELYLEPILVYSASKGKSVDIATLSGEKAWFLTKGNCFRMQMVNLCSSTDKNTELSVNYEGETLGTLINMVDSVGGYTMVPKFYLKYALHDSQKIKSIHSINPVRSIVGISRKRNSKSEMLEQIAEVIQREFQHSIESPTVVDWH